VVERLVLAGGFDSLYGLGEAGGVHRRGTVTRRDLLLQVADLDRYTRAVTRSATRGRGLASRAAPRAAQVRLDAAAGRNRRPRPEGEGVWARAQAQSRAPRRPEPVSSVQLTLDLGDAPADTLHSGEVSGLPEMDAVERVRSELEVLGLDVSSHVLDFYAPFLRALGTVRSAELLAQRSKAELLLAGVKVATQTPPIRSGRRVVFLTLDDGTGPADATFFEDALRGCATTVFHSWLLVVRGELRRTGRRGVSVRGTGCWDLQTLHDAWRGGGMAAVQELMAPVAPAPDPSDAEPHRVLVHSTGFRLSPYADIKPAGETPSRKLWHSSPGSSGR
jgi:error-prone DNA polymerase